jgi:hypothetical protein
MAKARGRLLRGSFGAVEVAEGKVILQEEKGIIGKRLVTIVEFPIAAATSTSLEKNKPPYRRFRRLTINHDEDGEGGEEVFFSQEDGALEAIKEIIDADIERRRIELDRDLAEQRLVREAHVHQLTLVLELLDHVFQTLFDLNGEPRWGPMKKEIAEAGRIIEEMKKLAVIAPLNYDVNGIAAAVAKRLVGGIKEECYAIISIVNRDAERLAYIEEPANGFDLELYEIFIKSYLLMWDMRLGEYLGGSVKEEELDKFMAYIDRLGGHVASGQCSQGLASVNNLYLQEGISYHFDRIRLLTHHCLNSLIE